MSQVEVDKIIPQSGTTLTIGDSGDTITITSGATLNGSISGITNLTMSGDLTIDTNTLKVDSTNNRVGVGTSNPLSKLEISDSSTINLNLRNTGLDNNGEIVSFQWDNNADFTIQGRDSNTVFKANWYKITSTATDGLADEHIWYTGSSAERMRITSSGNVGIGTTSPSQALDVNGNVNVTGTGNFVASGTRKAEVSGNGFSTFTGSPILDGGIEFTNQFGHAYSIGVSNGDSLKVFDSGTELLRVTSSGLLFNGAGSYLDDYEEGTFIPTLTPSTSGSVTINNSENELKYTKIGHTVFIQGRLSITAASSPTGPALDLGNLPFTPEAYSESSGWFGGMCAISFDGSSTFSPFTITKYNLATLAKITCSSVSSINSNTRLQFNFFYYTSS